MAKQYTFTEITAEMRKACPESVIAKIERENQLYTLQHMTEEEREAFNAKLAEEKAILKEKKSYQSQVAHNLTLKFDDEESRDSLLNLTLTRFFDPKYGTVNIIKNATGISTKVLYVVMGQSNKDNAPIVAKDMLKGKSNKLARAAAKVLTHNALIKNEDGSDEKYTGSNERINALIKGKNIGQFNKELDGYTTLSGKEKYPVTNVADLEEKSAAMKLFKQAVQAVRG